MRLIIDGNIGGEMMGLVDTSEYINSFSYIN